MHARMRTVLIAMVWKNKRDVCTLTNVHEPTVEGNFYDVCGKAHKLATSQYLQTQQIMYGIFVYV
jgi:hypothetical protein